MAADGAGVATIRGGSRLEAIFSDRFFFRGGSSANEGFNDVVFQL